MTTSEKVRILSDLSTRDEAGRHFTNRFNSDDIASLEAEGLIEVSRPIHEPTGIPYGEEYYSVSITEDGLSWSTRIPRTTSASAPDRPPQSRSANSP